MLFSTLIKRHNSQQSDFLIMFMDSSSLVGSVTMATTMYPSTLFKDKKTLAHSVKAAATQQSHFLLTQLAFN